MKIILICLVILVLFFLSGCLTDRKLVNSDISKSYFKKGNNIIYCLNGNVIAFSKTKLEGIDIQSFEVLSNQISKDKNFVFFGASKQLEVDVASFRIDNGIPKDNDHVYYKYSSGTTYKLNVIEDALPATFQYIHKKKPTWAKDIEHYFLSDRIVDVDYNSFELLNKNFAKDKDYFYLQVGLELEKISTDTKHVKLLSEKYAHDSDNVYCKISFNETKVISYQEVESLRVVNRNTIIIDSDVYYEAEYFEYTEVDAQTLRATGENAASFHVADKNNAYFKQKPISGADPNSFEGLGLFYSVDECCVYYKYEKVEGADPKSFVFDQHTYHDGYDKNHKYQQGVRVVEK